MSIKDEEIQNQIENANGGNGIDAIAYRKVFSALRKEPEFQLSNNFADKVIARIEVKKESSRDTFWIAVGVLGFLVVAMISVLLTDFRLDFGALKFISSYPGLITFGAAFILGLHLLDKKLVRPPVS